MEWRSSPIACETPEKGALFIYNGDGFCQHRNISRNPHSPADFGFITAPEPTGNAVLEESCSTSSPPRGAEPELASTQPLSSCPLQLLLLFSLTPNYLFPLYPISPHCLLLISDNFSPSPSSWSSDAKPTAGVHCRVPSRFQAIPLLSRWESSLSKDSSPCPSWFQCCDSVLTPANPNRFFLPAVSRSLLYFCCGEFRPILLPLFLKFTSHFMVIMNKK